MFEDLFDKRLLDRNPLIGKQQGIRFYVGMFVITSIICLKIMKYMKFKVVINLKLMLKLNVKVVINLKLLYIYIGLTPHIVKM